MKKTLLMVGFLVIVMVAIPRIATTFSGSASQQSASVMGSDFSEGWKAGWEAGWKHVKGQLSIAPIAPVAPLPPLGQNSYQGGYNNGFVAGMKAAQRR